MAVLSDEPLAEWLIRLRLLTIRGESYRLREKRWSGPYICGKALGFRACQLYLSSVIHHTADPHPRRGRMHPARAWQANRHPAWPPARAYQRSAPPSCTPCSRAPRPFSSRASSNPTSTLGPEVSFTPMRSDRAPPSAACAAMNGTHNAVVR